MPSGTESGTEDARNTTLDTEHSAPWTTRGTPNLPSSFSLAFPLIFPPSIFAPKIRKRVLLLDRGMWLRHHEFYRRASDTTIETRRYITAATSTEPTGPGDQAKKRTRRATRSLNEQKSNTQFLLLSIPKHEATENTSIWFYLIVSRHHAERNSYRTINATTLRIQNPIKLKCKMSITAVVTANVVYDFY